MILEDYEKLNPRCTVRHGEVEVVYATPNAMTKWRVDSIFEKEPCTIEWIAHFRAGEILVDVGANVGMYTVWSAKTRGVRVFAFEPESQNFALLNKNIVLNGLGHLVKAFPVALSDHSGLGDLHLSSFTIGGSCHSLDERVDFRHDAMTPAYSQGCVSMTLDELIDAGRVPVPDYIKLDVDGFEPKVIRGARRVLGAGKVKSLLIEVNRNLPDHLEMIEQLGTLGFRFDAGQVTRAERKDGPFKGCAEYVLFR